MGGLILSTLEVWPGEGRVISGSLSFPHLSFGGTVSGPAKDAWHRVSARCVVAPRVLTFNSKYPNSTGPTLPSESSRSRRSVAIRPLGVRLHGVGTENTRGWAPPGPGSIPAPPLCSPVLGHIPVAGAGASLSASTRLTTVLLKTGPQRAARLEGASELVLALAEALPM